MAVRPDGLDCPRVTRWKGDWKAEARTASLVRVRSPPSARLKCSFVVTFGFKSISIVAHEVRIEADVATSLLNVDALRQIWSIVWWW